MTRRWPQAHDRRELRVEAPDARRGLTLAGLLEGSTLTGSETEGWAVVGCVNGDLGDTLSTIERWLGDEAVDETSVRIGDKTYAMARR